MISNIVPVATHLELQKHWTHSNQHAAIDMQQLTCSNRHAAINMQQSSCSDQHGAIMQSAAGTAPWSRYMLWKTCGVLHDVLTI